MEEKKPKKFCRKEFIEEAVTTLYDIFSTNIYVQSWVRAIGGSVEQELERIFWGFFPFPFLLLLFLLYLHIFLILLLHLILIRSQ